MISEVVSVHRMEWKDPGGGGTSQEAVLLLQVYHRTVSMTVTDHFHPFGREGHGPFENIMKAMGVIPRKICTHVPHIMCGFGGLAHGSSRCFGIPKGHRNICTV